MRHPVRSGFTALALAALALTSPLATPASGQVVRLGGAGGLHPRIVNGVPAFGHPTVGALLRGGSPDTASAWCSGTLIGCETFLTAAHCVEGLDAGDFQVFLPNAGIFAVSRIDAHPAFDFPAGDVAVLGLAAPVDGVSPTPINTASAPPFGSTATIVGYGRSGGGAVDYGLKRSGEVVTATCTGIPAPGSDTTSVCWDYANPIGAPGTDSNTCNADSGGPLFVDFGSGDVVAGITSGGTSASCLPTDHSYDANVFTYRSFIESAGGADMSNTTCGNLSQVGSPGAGVLAASGELSLASPDAAHVFDVPAGTAVLRVAMNAEDTGAIDFDLYVKAGSPPTTSLSDCRRIGANQWAVCELETPAPGPWHVLVHRYAGAGEYQLTVTTFGPDCSNPVNDGAACDDTDPCTQNDVCSGGACVGAVAPDGTECDDGDPCAQPDRCQAGACTSAAPALGCKRPTAVGAASLLLADGSPDTRDRIAWRWNRGAQTDQAELGDPTSATDYALCLYDESGGPPERKLELAMPAGGGWRRIALGFRYRSTKLADGSRLAASVRAGADGKASITVTGHGAGLGLPLLPLTQQNMVRVQVLNGEVCWEADYSTSLKNLTERFKASSD